MKNEVLYQIATLTKFQEKGYNGIFPVNELTNYGNTGFGTFDKLDGEMIMIDEIVYQAFGDCKVKPALESETTPFATMGFLEKRKPIEKKVFGNMEKLSQDLDLLIDEKNQIVLSEIEGFFEEIVIHSVDPQTLPYLGLNEVVEAQEVFRYENVSGKLVGIRCPEKFKGINVVGWHFHFISSDHQIGGHVNDLFVKDIRVYFDLKETLEVVK
ncbi:MAG: acetolactate decarboxylase [Eubacteriaceae bacterium]